MTGRKVLIVAAVGGLMALVNPPLVAQSSPDSDYGGPLVFDGVQRTPSLTDEQMLVGRSVGEISLRLRGAPESGPGEILLLRGHDTLIMLDPAGDGLDLQTTGGQLPLEADVRGPVDLVLRREPAPPGAGDSGEQWVAYVDGTRAGALEPGAAIPLDDELLALTLGGQASASAASRFQGVVEHFAVRTPEGYLYVHTPPGQPSGAPRLVRRTLPSTGSYVAVGGYKAQQRAKVAGIDDAHHGIFEKTDYYAVTAGPQPDHGASRVLIVADWGGALELRPDLAHQARYVAVDPAQAWAGSIEFEDPTASARRPRFTVRDGLANRFLRSGARYEMAPAQPVSSDQAKTVFDAGTNVPNFYFSVMACYDVRGMDLVDLQKRGCAERPIFAFPGNSGTRDQGVLKNVPFGWTYIPFNTLSARSQSSLVTSAEDLSNAYSGGSSHGFQVAAFGAGYSHRTNQAVENEFRTLREQERSMTLDQSFRTESHLVLIPDEVALDKCFIQNVMRAAATVSAAGRPLAEVPSAELPVPPRYFDAVAADVECRDGEIDDPLTPAQLVELYGTHYAHATTYGARSITRRKMRKELLRSVVKEAQSSKTQEGFKLDLSKMPRVKVPASIGIEHGDESASRRGRNQANSIEQVVVETFCVGAQSGCSANDVTIGSEPAPVYLDLRRFDQLLAPPFFTDRQVLRELRPRVRAEIDRILADDPPPTVPPVMRILDVTVSDKKCHYTREAVAPNGRFYPGFEPLRDACEQLPAVLGVFARQPDGSADLLAFEPPELNGEPWLFNRDALVGQRDRRWLLMPALEPCPPAGCGNSESRLVIEPAFNGRGATELIFKALPEPLFADYPVELSADCTGACAVRYAPTAELDERGTEIRGVAWSPREAPLNRQLVPSNLVVDPRQPLPPRLTGRMLTEQRADGVEQLGVDFELTLEEVDLAGLLGFSATLDAAEARGPRYLEDVAPHLPIRLSNGGGYVVRFEIDARVPERSLDGSRILRPLRVRSDRLALAQEYLLRLPVGAQDVRISAIVYGALGRGRNEPALQQTIPALNEPFCRRTYGTIFSPQWKSC